MGGHFDPGIWKSPITYNWRIKDIDCPVEDSITCVCAVMIGNFLYKKLEFYLEHCEFILEINNQALSWFLSHPRQLEKIGRWVVKIASIKFQIS